MKDTNEIINIERASIPALFVGDNLKETLERIEKEALSILPDTSTSGGRKKIASLARSVARSKIIIDDAGKELVRDWKSKAKLVDASRKDSRDFLDNLRDKVRNPLTVWEQEQKEMEAAELLAKEIESCHVDALAMNSLIDRENELKIRELKAAEAERVIQEAKEKLEREEQARAMAAKEKLEKARREDERAKEIKEMQAKQEAEAEEKRIIAIEKAAQDKIDAVNQERERAAQEAERLEGQRLLKIEKELRKKQVENERIAIQKANKEHIKKINNEALDSITDAGIDRAIAREVIVLICKGKVKNVTINY